MATGSKGRKRRNPATYLTDDLVVEIISRLPVKSVCRFKCVSKHWRGLISHPDHRKKLPQALASFFYCTYSGDCFPESTRQFTNVTGRGAPLIRPSLSFLPGNVNITILDCCNGLLLYRYWKTAGATSFFFCNLATEEWTALLESSHCETGTTMRLGFDPATSPHFYVFGLLETVPETIHDYNFIDGLEIYSSETKEWVRKDNGWSGNVQLPDDPSTVFLNSFLHAGRRGGPVPYGNDDGFIGLSQGHLYYLNPVYDFELSIYVLEDYATDECIFKHSVSTTELLGMHTFGFQRYRLMAIHPECYLIFFVSDIDNTIRCYDMEHRKVNVIYNMGCELESWKSSLAYVPLFQSHLQQEVKSSLSGPPTRSTSIYSGTHLVAAWLSGGGNYVSFNLL
ncbi:hypothetical protein BS78_01G313600 [Paspalum vaginatum]|nr:hypothetical protein BS78_01G313600 [Paspalum vaginatum]